MLEKLIKKNKNKTEEETKYHNWGSDFDI